ncbi:MAG: aminotransferase class IV [Bacteroidales bacterium]|jgi:branched-chain amino acid aminotransferase|nr:aminotransferase class IV [Bacteroidales bacterium]
MPVNTFILYNGEYFPREEFGVSITNRSFCYGDGLFETMHANGTEIQFFEDHLIRLKYGMNVLKMQIPEIIGSGNIFKEIIKLLHKNKLYQGVRIRLSVFRNDGGKYTPTSNSTSYLVETEFIDNDRYTINQKGLITDIFPEIQKPINPFSNLKTSNALIYVMAGIYASEKKLDDCIILNEKGFITETISSNIFLLKDKFILTPPLTDGPVAGIMRKQILKIADMLQYRIYNEKSLTEKNIIDADEMFLTNSITGIKWVLAFKEKRFFNNSSQQFIDKLNEIAFRK